MPCAATPARMRVREHRACGTRCAPPVLGQHTEEVLRELHQRGRRETAERLNQQLVQRALRLEGTCTGEHGVGLHKQGFLVEEAGESNHGSGHRIGSSWVVEHLG